MRTRMIKNFKSSILGIVFLAVGIWMITKQQDYNVYVAGGLLASGVMLLFCPDKYINLLERSIIGRVLFENKQENQE